VNGASTTRTAPLCVPSDRHEVGAERYNGLLLAHQPRARIASTAPWPRDGLGSGPLKLGGEAITNNVTASLHLKYVRRHPRMQGTRLALSTCQGRASTGRQLCPCSSVQRGAIRLSMGPIYPCGLKRCASVRRVGKSYDDVDQAEHHAHRSDAGQTEVAPTSGLSFDLKTSRFDVAI